MVTPASGGASRLRSGRYHSATRRYGPRAAKVVLVSAEPAAHLGLAAHAAHFVVQAFAFGGEFDDGLDQALVDVALRLLLARDTDQTFEVCYRHGSFPAVHFAVLAGRLPPGRDRRMRPRNEFSANTGGANFTGFFSDSG